MYLFSFRRAWAAAVALAMILFCAAWVPTLACDTCGCAQAPINESTLKSGWNIGIAEQYTDFYNLQQDGQKVANQFAQRINSSLTQFLVGYNFDDRVGLQLSLPYISRSYRRAVGDDNFMERGIVSGLGDIALNAHYVAALEKTGSETLLATVQAGLKLPTGNTSYLKEQVLALQGGPDSVVGGHDLTLGSGSVDATLGGSLYFRERSFLLTASMQYSLRTAGTLGYRFANEFQWDCSPGAFLIFEPDKTLAIQLAINGETKGMDSWQGQSVTDTAVTEVYVGPRLTASWSGGNSALLDLSLPVHEDNSDLQLVPSYRVHLSYVHRF